MTEHRTTTEHVPVLRSVAVCSCGWRGNPQMFLEWAEANGREHIADPAAVGKGDPLVAAVTARLAARKGGKP